MRYLRFLLLGLVALATLVVGPVPVAQAATFTVDNTGDAVDANPGDGTCATAGAVCTLRAAIEEANHPNNPGLDTINFNIPGAGPHTISPGSGLPIITDPVVIDGYTQPGASPNTNPVDLGSNALLMIELNGAGAGWEDGVRITAGSSTVKGLVINRFLNGIMLTPNGGNVVEGNYIGTDVSGTIDLGNHWDGVFMSGDSPAPGNIIGGTAAEARNVISGNDRFGVVIDDPVTGALVQGNYIGTDKNGTAGLGNHVGVIISSAPGNTIGGITAAERNVISGNEQIGVVIGGTNNTTGNLVQGNFIGTDVTGTADLGNSYDGVVIAGTPSGGPINNTIGGTAAGAGNVITHNGIDGVRVDGTTATGNTIRGNSIHSNGRLGIENTNGGNTELAPPTVTAAGSASGTACANCTVDVYSDDADEGRVYHGSNAADGSGNWSFPGAVTGPNITATATDGSGNTSEFSAPFACPDTDGDGVNDCADNCPAWPNPDQSLPPWPVPPGDADCDGFATADEGVIGTDPADPCANTPDPNDEADDRWPSDFDDNQVINILDVGGVLPPYFGTSVPPTSPRRDLVPDGFINILDVGMTLPPYFGYMCAP